VPRWFIRHFALKYYLDVATLTETTTHMYEELSSELLALSQTWRYVHDMTSDRFATDTLNRASAPYFGTVLSALFAYGLTLLARLLDPARTGKRENCSLSALASIREDLDPGLMGSLNDIRERAVRLLEYRNKQIAHLDRVTTLHDDDDQPRLFSWVGMHDTINDLCCWMNTFESSAGLPAQHYNSDESWSDVDEVRSLLRRGLSADPS
jgi:hypothetical protein